MEVSLFIERIEKLKGYAKIEDIAVAATFKDYLAMPSSKLSNKDMLDLICNLFIYSDHWLYVLAKPKHDGNTIEFEEEYDWLKRFLPGRIPCKILCNLDD